MTSLEMWFRADITIRASRKEIPQEWSHLRETGSQCGSRDRTGHGSYIQKYMTLSLKLPVLGFTSLLIASQISKFQNPESFVVLGMEMDPRLSPGALWL